MDGFFDAGSVASGSVTLSLAFLPEPILRPANDHFSDRPPLTFGGSNVVVRTTNRNATRETAEPLHAGKLGDASLWWSWTAPAAGLVLATTTGSDYDTLLAVYSGTSLSNLVEVASSDDEDPANAVLTSSLSFQAEAGHTTRWPWTALMVQWVTFNSAWAMRTFL